MHRWVRHLSRLFFRHALRYTIIFLIVYSLILYAIFFTFNAYFETNTAIGSLPVFASLDEVQHATGFLTYSTRTSRSPVQPINVIIEGPQDIEAVFTGLGWIENASFSSQNISLRNFYALLKGKTPPISDLYVNGHIQTAAFQIKSDSIFNRTHIRLWKFGMIEGGEVIYLGSVSTDHGLDFEWYRHFLVPLHAFDPNVDKARSTFLSFVESKIPSLRYVYMPWGIEKKLVLGRTDVPYVTDGKVLTLTLPDVAPSFLESLKTPNAVPQGGDSASQETGSSVPVLQ